MSLKVRKPGLLTTVQDLGRYGYQKHGVIVAGVMDPFALRVANLLVGNDENEGGLEMTMLGATLEFQQNALIAISGGNLSPSIDGKAVPMWRPVFVKSGSVLACKALKTGCRAYLAVAGGFDIPLVMGSRTTFLRGGIGGYKGRALQADDVLMFREPSQQAGKRLSQLESQSGTDSFSSTHWFVSTDILPAYTDHPVVRVMRGGQFDHFAQGSIADFYNSDFQVTPQSDRMGYRLEGMVLKLSEPLELISEAVVAGTIQVPPEGNPIVLLAARQTTGGYPKIAQVITVDLPLMAQIKPGQKVRFQEVTLQEAQELYLMREVEIQRLKQGLVLMER